MNINFGNIEFGKGLIGICGKVASGRTAIRKYITESSMNAGVYTFTNRFETLRDRDLTSTKGFLLFDHSKCDDISYDDLVYIHDNCMKYDQTAIIFGTITTSKSISNAFHIFKDAKQMLIYDQVHTIQDMKLSTIKNKYGANHSQIFEFVKRLDNTGYMSSKGVFADPCVSQEKQFAVSQKSVCPECKGAKQILMLDSFVSCNLCG